MQKYCCHIDNSLNGLSAVEAIKFWTFSLDIYLLLTVVAQTLVVDIQLESPNVIPISRELFNGSSVYCLGMHLYAQTSELWTRELPQHGAAHLIWANSGLNYVIKIDFGLSYYQKAQ